MFPVLLRIGPFTFHTYGLLVALGVLLGSKIAIGLACREGFEREKVEEPFYQFLFYFVVGGIVGGRLFYVLLYWQEFSEHYAGIFKIWQGGLVSYGGLLGAGTGFFFWYRKNKIFPWAKFVDWLAPALAFGHALGRLGCFSAGCCYGTPTEKPWGIVFTHPQSLAPLDIPLHPTQLYEFIFLIFLGFFLLWKSDRKKFSPRRADGHLFADYLTFYPIGRFTIEFFRGDDPRIWGLTPGQLMSLFILALSVFFRRALDKKK